MMEKENSSRSCLEENLKIARKIKYRTADELKTEIHRLVMRHFGKDYNNMNANDLYHALSLVVHDDMNFFRVLSSQQQKEIHKQVYYLSMEFLPGKHLRKDLLNKDMYAVAEEVVRSFGFSMEEVLGIEHDPALGNGGLGRLAACFLDSATTHNYPLMGYGMLYEFGLFRQSISQGEQEEHPENWLRYGDSWLTERPSHRFLIHFYGYVEGGSRGEKRVWVPTEHVDAVAYDMPISGYGTTMVNCLRLWRAFSAHNMDFKKFNEGNYIESVAHSVEREAISKILYPNDSNLMGQELRLKQEYFFVSAALQDILLSFRQKGIRLEDLKDHLVLHLNDTHPALATVEFIRLMVDENSFSLKDAVVLCQSIFCYTNHTLMQEALERWSSQLFQKVLPRHFELLQKINSVLLWQICPDMAAASTEDVRKLNLARNILPLDDLAAEVRMGYLCLWLSRKVNGVAAVHSDLLKTSLFEDFYQIMPEKFTNVTNGITQRRWLLCANGGLAAAITERLGEGWITDLSIIEKLKAYAQDMAFHETLRSLKDRNKNFLAQLIRAMTGTIVDTHSLFDVQIKRIHEYKRQLLKVLHIVYQYLQIKNGLINLQDIQPRTFIFAGKAAPSYSRAKEVISLINALAYVINSDRTVRNYLQVIFIPDYNVTRAEAIIPAAELSEQISMAGTEASGTGNMKLALNGALTIGTRDGANIEMAEQIGEEHMFLFGLSVEEVRHLKQNGYDPQKLYRENSILQEVLGFVSHLKSLKNQENAYGDLVESLLGGGDRYMVLADFDAYVQMQKTAESCYRQPDLWHEKVVHNIASMGFFSADRSIKDYAGRVWDLKALDLPPIG